MHYPGNPVAHALPFKMHRAGSEIGATITPKDTAIKDIAAVQGGKNILQFDAVWAIDERIAQYGATRINLDVRTIELLEDFSKEVGRGPCSVRDVSELHECAGSGFSQHHQSLNCIAALFAQFHLDSTDEFNPLTQR